MKTIATIRTATSKTTGRRISLKTVNIGNVADCGIRYGVESAEATRRGDCASMMIFPSFESAAAEYRSRVA